MVMKAFLTLEGSTTLSSLKQSKEWGINHPVILTSLSLPSFLPSLVHIDHVTNLEHATDAMMCRKEGTRSKGGGGRSN